MSQLTWKCLDSSLTSGGSLHRLKGLGISAKTATSAIRTWTKQLKMDGWTQTINFTVQHKECIIQSSGLYLVQLVLNVDNLQSISPLSYYFLLCQIILLNGNIVYTIPV